MRRVLNSRINSCERYTRKHDFAGEVCGAHQNGRAPAGAHRGWDPGMVFSVRAPVLAHHLQIPERQGSACFSALGE
jgi:hypothetical protein